jgi:hypothetical protein
VNLRPRVRSPARHQSLFLVDKAFDLATKQFLFRELGEGQGELPNQTLMVVTRDRYRGHGPFSVEPLDPVHF